MFKCPTCSARFDNRKALSNHTRRPNKCKPRAGAETAAEVDRGEGPSRGVKRRGGDVEDEESRTRVQSDNPLNQIPLPGGPDLFVQPDDQPTQDDMQMQVDDEDTSEAEINIPETDSEPAITVPTLRRIKHLANPHIPSAPLLVEDHHEEDIFLASGHKAFRTRPNEWGIYRIYPFGRPTYAPDLGTPVVSNLRVDTALPYAPFDNMTTHRLINWHMAPTSGVNRLQALVKDVINQPDFDPHDLEGFNAAKELSKLDTFDPETCGLPEPASWIKTSVEVPVPGTRRKKPLRGCSPHIHR
ncbi:hypothetical protein BKA70DRAFT_863136 [Coprinopsis sp. MPI-PUGE-AT-0042]|nr:hypothetical protein BKA70DRAFT_863136 [Coprinopsis sp. MPI-PUGE-AT-0042]